MRSQVKHMGWWAVLLALSFGTLAQAQDAFYTFTSGPMRGIWVAGSVASVQGESESLILADARLDDRQRRE